MMVAVFPAIAQRRKFRLGTTGWTVDDLDDARTERLWLRGRYEIVEGVLTTLPPADLDEALPMGRVSNLLNRHQFEQRSQM
jgi:hypothetical protein